MKINQIRIEFLLLLLIIVLGFGLRIYGLDRSLWLDEVISVDSQSDLQRHLSNIYEPMHIYFVILHFFMLFGTNEIMIRLASVIFGVMSIFLIYKLGELLFGRPKEGLVGAFLLSISTMHIWFSQEARYYSFSMFLTLLSFLFFYMAIKEKSKKLWVGYIFSTILAVLSHWFMILVLFVEIVFLVFILFKNRGSFLSTAIKIGKKKIVLLLLFLIIISGLILLPLIQQIIDLFLSGSATGGVSAWGIPPESFFQELFIVFSLGFSSSFLSRLFGSFLAIGFFYMFILFFLLGFIYSIKKHREQAILLLLWVILPSMVIFLFSIYAGSPVATPKYLIFILPGYLLGVARGISIISRVLLKYYYKIFYGISSIPLLKHKQKLISSGLTLIILGTFLGVSAVPLNEYYKTPQEDWKAAAAYLETNSHQGDVIIVEPDILQPCLFYYYERNPTTSDFMKNITTTIMPAEFPFADFEDLISKHNRTWIVLSPRHERHVYWKILNWTNTNSINIKTFTEVSIYYYDPESLLISTNNMSFVGLDSSPDDPVAKFWHNNDMVSFNLDIMKPKNYEIAIHTRSGWTEEHGWFGTSYIELEIDGILKNINFYSADDWQLVNLGTYYLDSGSHEINITCRIGEEFGNTGIQFDTIAIWSMQ